MIWHLHWTFFAEQKAAISRAAQQFSLEQARIEGFFTKPLRQSSPGDPKLPEF